MDREKLKTLIKESSRHKNLRNIAYILSESKIDDIKTGHIKKGHKDVDNVIDRAVKANKEGAKINLTSDFNNIRSEVEKHETKRVNRAELKPIHSENGVQIKHIPNKESCISNYGHGKTKWCIAATGEGNAFEGYQGTHGRKVYAIHHDKDEQAPYAWHEQELKFRNKNDEEVNFKDLHTNIQKSIANYAHGAAEEKGHSGHKTAMLMASTTNKNPHLKLDNGLIEKASSHPDGAQRYSAAVNYKPIAKHILEKNEEKDPHIFRGIAEAHPDLVEEYKLDEHKSAIVRRGAAVHPEFAKKLINDKAESVRSVAQNTLQSYKPSLSENKMINSKKLLSLIKESAKQENIGFFITESRKKKHKKKKPYHSYVTKDGHHVDIHLEHNPDGSGVAKHYNKNLKAVVKKVYWWNHSSHPSKSELMESIIDIEARSLIIELFVPQVLSEREHGFADMDGDTGGKIAENSAVMHVHKHILEQIDSEHKNKGTEGSIEHQSQRAPHVQGIETHQKEIERLGKDKHPDDVATRVEHGSKMAFVAIDHALSEGRKKFGKKAVITGVGHTAKSGDIGKFTEGRHNDGQENPSDFAIQVKPSRKSTESHYEGFSLKSSKEANRITAKNPAIDFGAALNHPSRSLGTEKISRNALKIVRRNTLKSRGINDYRNRTAADMGRLIKSEREREGVKSNSGIETEANRQAYKSKNRIARELHNHIQHLTNNVGQEGHDMIRNLLTLHLTAQTSMPWSKIHAKGKSADRVTATIEPGNKSEIANLISKKSTRFTSTLKGGRVTIHAIDDEGNHTALAHYSPKPKSNALKADVHGWNVLPAKKSQ